MKLLKALVSPSLKDLLKSLTSIPKVLLSLSRKGIDNFRLSMSNLKSLAFVTNHTKSTSTGNSLLEAYWEKY